jgi:tetratricopeptide (TPR) repeat protein
MSHRHYNRVPRTREFPVKWWQAALIVAGSVGAIAAIGFLTGTGQAEKKSKKTAQNAKPKQQEASSYDLFATLLHQSKQSKAAGDFKYAEEYAMKAYEYAKQTLGEKSEIVGLVLFMLYDIYSSQHNLERAEWALLQAISVLKLHQNTKETYAFSLRNLADIYTIQERYKEAEPLSEEASSIIDLIHENDPEHENVGMALASLGNIKANLGKYQEAEKAFKRALAISKKRFGYNNMITIQCILKYGLMLLDVGRVEEAEKTFKDTIALMEKEAEANPDLPKQNTMPFLRHLADLYIDTGNFAQAETILLKFKEVSKHTGFEQHAHLCLETLYWQTGREEDAINERNQMKNLVKDASKAVPMTSSKYLLSKTASLEASSSKPNVYHMKLLIKRATGAKKSNGQFGRELKLQAGSLLEFHFDNPEKPSEPLITSVELSDNEQESIEVTSEVVSGIKLHEFYEVKVYIYNNRERETKLAVHHQLVRAEDSDVDKEKKVVPRFVV